MRIPIPKVGRQQPITWPHIYLHENAEFLAEKDGTHPERPLLSWIYYGSLLKIGVIRSYQKHTKLVIQALLPSLCSLKQVGKIGILTSRKVVKNSIAVFISGAVNSSGYGYVYIQVVGSIHEAKAATKAKKDQITIKKGQEKIDKRQRKFHFLFHFLSM